MVTRDVWVVFVAGALGLSGPAAAQDRVFVSGGVERAPYTQEIVAIGNFGAPLGPMSPLVHQPLIAGGRYAVATLYCESSPCVVVDWQGVAHVIPHAFASMVATDPVRPRVFVRTASGAIDAVDVETGAVAPMFSPSIPVSDSCRYAFSVERLFCLESGAAPSLRVFATSGAPGEEPQVVGTVASRPSGSYPWLVTPDGSRLFAGAPGNGSELLVLTYVVTGTRLAAALPSVWDFAWDDFNERLLALPAAHLGHAFTKDLAYLGSAWFPFTGTALAVSPATGRLYVRGLFAQSAGYGDAYTTAFDSRTYAPLTPSVHSQGFGGGPRLTVLSPPGAPRDVAAVVTGTDVTLTWTNVGVASAFFLEVGAVPGQTAFTIPLSWQSRAVFATVPPGIYYVRLRGANTFGTGRPSAEVRVVVP
jgi:hypothetical protein